MPRHWFDGSDIKRGSSYNHLDEGGHVDRVGGEGSIVRH